MIAARLPTTAFIALLLGLPTSGCMGPSGGTVEEKRASAREMRTEALAAVYEEDPDLEEKVKESAGYAVFSNFSIHPGLFSFATGYGLITNNGTGKETHTKWLRFTLGPGIAVKGLYALVIFQDADLLARFEKGAWPIGGQAEATFVFGDFGGGLDVGWLFRRGVEVHYVTHTGVALELEVIGIGRVSNNSKLNRDASP